MDVYRAIEGRGCFALFLYPSLTEQKKKIKEKLTLMLFSILVFFLKLKTVSFFPFPNILDFISD